MHRTDYHVVFYHARKKRKDKPKALKRDSIYRSPVCLACAWVLVQAGRAGVGSRADVKIVSPVLSRAESRCGAGRGSFSDMNLSHCCQKTNLTTNFLVIRELETLLRE